MTQQDNTLLQLRQEIDTIDDAIIDLLKKRMHVVDQVGHHKKALGTYGCFLKPGREASILSRVTEKLQPEFPKQAIAIMWRMIISSSLNREQPLSVSVYGGESSKAYWLAREYFGPFIPMTEHHNVGSVLTEIEQSKATLGVLPLTDSGKIGSHRWWQNLDKDLAVFACLPSVEEKISEGDLIVVLGKVLPEATGDDSTLLVFNAPSSIGRSVVNAVLKDYQLNPDWLAEASTPGVETEKDYVVRLNGFIQQEDPALKALAKKVNHLRIIGSYANPITIHSQRKTHVS